MQGRAHRAIVLATLLALAGGGVLSAEDLRGSATAEWDLFEKWERAYREAGGDRDVRIPLASSRAYVTERIAAHGELHLDLIGGTANVELSDLDRAVDVWLLDNKPGPGKSILPEEGDRLIHLARVVPDGDGVGRAANDLGPDAFLGVEVNWILVSEAGVDPSESRLLLGVRPYFEILSTRARLRQEGFEEEPVGPVRSSRPSVKNEISPEPLPFLAKTPHEILVKKGLVSDAVFKGGEVFFRETFEGNGRSCGTCHPVENNQTIDTRFIASLPDNDPLFVAEQRPPYDPISQLERPPLMRNFGLILENVDGLEDPNVKFLMRSVPHSLSMSTSIRALPGDPNFQDRTGWSGDGAPSPGRLIEFLLGAIIQHYPDNSLARVFKEDVPPGEPFDFRMPTDSELELTNEFMLNVGRLDELTLGAVALTDANAEAGRIRFIGSACNGCHSNASANISSGFNLNFFTGVERVPNPAQGFDGIFFPSDGGFGGQGLQDPNFDCDGDGVLDCFGNGQFNTPPLVEAADTAPFFHNNTAATIEDAVRFYNAPPFPAPLGFTDQEILDVAAFLRVINASFNLQIAAQRTRAAAVIDPEADLVPSKTEFVGIRGTANRLLLLSNEEIEDAVEVLAGGPLGTLNPDAAFLARAAHRFNRLAVSATQTNVRAAYMERAVDSLREATAALGTGTALRLGEGNLLF